MLVLHVWLQADCSIAMVRAIVLALAVCGASGFTAPAQRTAPRDLTLAAGEDLKFPVFGGSTGGWMRAATTEEKYAITWTSPKQQIFEMPIGGAAMMNEGRNLAYFARKEQCLALGTQLRTFKLNDYKVYRIFPSGEVQFLHPKDGVFPEKTNEGRVGVNNPGRRIGQNPNPIDVKFSGVATFDAKTENDRE